ncbi:suppressor protein SRP40-like [Amaranthus tricolor]|uniref:suppressor protein SRP40-like n=1 Tax=Amaranthus tricolor TaxID=29722 RepID=UPI00258E8B29|nr:suppressor protein SRP40-like [Amaranthus tricolor]
MIKRRFYRAEHNEKDKGSSGSSSSSSDSEIEVRSSDDSDNEPSNPEPEPDSNVEAEINADNDEPKHSSSSSGYESEDSSAYEIEADSAGIPGNDDDSASEKDGDKHNASLLSSEENGEITEKQGKDNPSVDDLPSCVLRSKSVYKCRLCPKIVCLNEESLKGHLKSKRHSRSEKLLNEGRLKRILNSDGEEEELSDEDGETHAERHARILAMAQDASKKKGTGRQRQRLRLKRKMQRKSSNIPNSGQQTENRAKRRKNVD